MSNLPPPGAGLHHLIAANLSVGAHDDIAARVNKLLDLPAAKPRRPRRPTLARALAEAAEAGASVAHAEITETGVKLTFGQSKPLEPLTGANPWDTIYDQNQKRAS
jgi:hypothetical protein